MNKTPKAVITLKEPVVTHTEGDNKIEMGRVVNVYYHLDMNDQGVVFDNGLGFIPYSNIMSIVPALL